jgi:hypothetical protein
MSALCSHSSVEWLLAVPLSAPTPSGEMLCGRADAPPAVEMTELEEQQIPSGNDRKKSKSPLPSWRTTDHGRKPAPGKGSLLGWGGMTKDPCISFFSGRHS